MDICYCKQLHIQDIFSCFTHTFHAGTYTCHCYCMPILHYGRKKYLHNVFTFVSIYFIYCLSGWSFHYTSVIVKLYCTTQSISVTTVVSLWAGVGKTSCTVFAYMGCMCSFVSLPQGITHVGPIANTSLLHDNNICTELWSCFFVDMSLWFSSSYICKCCVVIMNITV